MKRHIALILLLGISLSSLYHAAAQVRAGKPRVAIAGILHETNSFNAAPTTLKDFIHREIVSPETALAEWAKNSDDVSGFIEAARREGLELYPSLIADADPKGLVTDRAFDALVTELIAKLKAAPKLDGLLLCNHGAMVIKSHPHGDAEVVRRLRLAFGETFPIVVTHDFHANISPEIVKLSTALLTGQENPHLDLKARGIRAATIMARLLRGEIKPTQAVVKPPMIWNIVYQNTGREPFRPLLEESRRLEQNPKILAVSVSGGYQYADVPAMGPSVVVVTDNDPALAEREAQRLADQMWALRDKLALKLPDAAEAVRQAMKSEKTPVVLIDLGDNIGGGSAGDSTFLLDELLKQQAQSWVMTVYDPAAVKTAIRAGVGSNFDFLVGGKTDALHGKPVRVRGRVKSLPDGQYIEPEVRHGGGHYHSQGLTAVIEVAGSTRDLPNLLLVTAERTTPDSLHQLISCGVYPQRQKMLVAKGAIAPRASYEPIAGRFIEADTGGATAVNPARFTYKHVRRPLFGLTERQGK